MYDDDDEAGVTAKELLTIVAMLAFIIIMSVVLYIRIH